MPSLATMKYEKPSNLFVQTFNESENDFFDQFITFSPSNDALNFSDIPDSTFRGEPDKKGRPTEASANALREAGHIEQDWQGDSWVFAHDAASPHDHIEDSFFYTELSGRAAISNPELLSLEEISLEPQLEAWSHPSLPSSPVPGPTKRKTRLKAIADKWKKAGKATEKILRSPIRKSSNTPKMIKGSSSNGKLSRNALERNKPALSASKFGLDIHAPMSPPDSAKLPNGSDQLTKKHIKTEGIEDLWDMSHSLQFPTAPAVYDTPHTTPNLGVKGTPDMCFQQSPLNGTIYPMTPKSHHVSASWPQIRGSTSFSSLGASPEYPAEVEPDGNALWWNHASTAPMAQPSPSAFYRNSQRATKSLAYHLQNEVSYAHNQMDMSSGLMISMPDSMPQQSYVVESPPMLHQGYHSVSTNGNGSRRFASFPAPRARYAQHSHSHSSPSSTQKPSHTPPRLRKSRSSPSASESPSLKSSPAFHVRKQTKSKNKNGSPRTPTSNGGMVGFVNYTPEDSRKILTGVAPSGSSKTKARREKEAMEKRRKLSLAALKAIEAAGGDVGSLVKEGLLV
ncbi:developmental regulatory protein [Rutstroemia sp. NJR-2017a BVV2]|nr:developmental regulatory protein [Rutstroemia sp. NJR-2017a BVV2]